MKKNDEEQERVKGGRRRRDVFVCMLLSLSNTVDVGSYNAMKRKGATFISEGCWDRKAWRIYREMF